MTCGWMEMMRFCFFMRWISCLLRTAACSRRCGFLFLECSVGFASRDFSAASIALSPVAWIMAWRLTCCIFATSLFNSF